MTRTRSGILTVCLPLAVLIADSYFELGLGDAARGPLVLAVLGGGGLLVDGIQRRFPRGRYADRADPCDDGLPPRRKTRAEAVEEVMVDRAKGARRREP